MSKNDDLCHLVGVKSKASWEIFVTMWGMQRSQYLYLFLLRDGKYL